MNDAVRTESKHTVLLIVSTGVTALLSFIYTLYAINLLGTSRAADLVAALSMVAFFQVALGPINGTVAKFTAQFSANGEGANIAQLQRQATQLVVRHGGVGLLICCLLALPIARVLNYESAVPVALAFVIVWLNLLLSVARGVLRGLERFPSFSLNTVLEAVVRLGLGVAILHAWTSVSGGLLGFVAALILIIIVSRVQLADVWQCREPGFVDAQVIKNYLKPMCVMMAVTGAFDNVDMQAVQAFFEAESAGVYGAAFTLARTMSVLVTPFGILILPMVAGLQARGAPVRKSIMRMCGYFVAICVAPLVVFALIPSQVLTLVRLEEFPEAAPLLLPLTGARFIGYLNGLIALAYAGLGRFGFLKLLLPALTVEIALLIGFHDSLMTVVWIALTVQAGTLLALVAYAFMFRSGSRTTDGGTT